MFEYPFTEHEAQAAYDEWNANCGPTSLAFALQIGLDQVRGKIPGFNQKGYTSPTMMKAGLAALGRTFLHVYGELTEAAMFHKNIALTRIQWCGPWTKPGANARWAYGATHWVASWAHEEKGAFLGYKSTKVGLFVFDCNGGIRSFDSWKKEIIPLIVESIPRADGMWFPTHVWRITP